MEGSENSLSKFIKEAAPEKLISRAASFLLKKSIIIYTKVLYMIPKYDIIVV